MKNIQHVFPRATDIPEANLKDIPCIQAGYLVNGEIRVWDGPRQEVLSPARVSGSTGPKPFFIGEYPVLTETEALQAHDAWLVMGSTVILKPPKHGALLYAPLLAAFRDVFPKGVINVIYGEGRKVIPPLMASGKINVLGLIGTRTTANKEKKDKHKREEQKNGKHILRLYT